MSEIKTPNFGEKINPEEVKTIYETVVEHYMDENGEYFKNNLHNFGDKTRLIINLAETLKIMCTPKDKDGKFNKDYNKEEYMQHISKKSVSLYNSIPDIIEMMKDNLPTKLVEFHWMCHEIEISYYNPTYVGWKGKDSSKLTKFYGAPAFNIILWLKPASKFPVCASTKTEVDSKVEKTLDKKPVANVIKETKETKDIEETEVTEVTKETEVTEVTEKPSETKTKPVNVWKTYASSPSVVAPAKVKKPFTGK